MVDIPWSLINIIILAIIVLVGIIVIWRTLGERKSGFPARDERTERVTGKAATYAFYIGSYFMVTLMLANIVNREFLGFFLLDVGYALVMSILVQSLAFLVFRWYFNRKSDFK